MCFKHKTLQLNCPSCQTNHLTMSEDKSLSYGDLCEGPSARWCYPCKYHAEVEILRPFLNDYPRDYLERRAQTATEYARERGGDRLTVITAEDLIELVTRQRGDCPVCGSDLRERRWEIDHDLPVTRGGTNKIYNLQLICAGCNEEKGTSTTGEVRILSERREQDVWEYDGEEYTECSACGNPCKARYAFCYECAQMS